MNPAHNTEERGASAVEYAILVALISVVVIPALALSGSSLSGVLSNVSSRIAAATPAAEIHNGAWEDCTDEQMAQMAQDAYAAAGLTPPEGQEGYAPYVDWNTCTVMLETPSAPWAGCTQDQMDQAVVARIDEYSDSLRSRRSAYIWEQPEGWGNAGWHQVLYSDEQVEAEIVAAGVALRAARTEGHTVFELGAVIHDSDGQVATGSADVYWDSCDTRLEGRG